MKEICQASGTSLRIFLEHWIKENVRKLSSHKCNAFSNLLSIPEEDNFLFTITSNKYSEPG
jgi:succinate dehydrogenase flavin-adding protein (antitoxin of CptAB toxin-antitoxin module)